MSMTPEERRAYRQHENAMHAARQAMWRLRARARRREGGQVDGLQREYIGMGITVETDGGELCLSTMHDYFETEIYIEPATLATLVTFAKRCGL